MPMALSEVHRIVERVCARQDVLDACADRDLGAVITVLNAHGVTQGLIADLTGIRQGRLSEYVRRKRVPMASTTFQAFADGTTPWPGSRERQGPISMTLGGMSGRDSTSLAAGGVRGRS